MRVYLAAISTGQNWHALKGSDGEWKKIPYVLESVRYFEPHLFEIIDLDTFMLDSGAFTFMTSSKKKVDFDEYLSKYIEFISKHDIKLFFELDIDSVVGYEQVSQYRLGGGQAICSCS